MCDESNPPIAACGCDQPRSSLALSLPESGCPARCPQSTAWRIALGASGGSSNPHAPAPPLRSRATNVRSDVVERHISVPASLPCVDSAIDDPVFNSFLQNWWDVADTWPVDWKSTSHIMIDLFQRFGCNYLNMNSPADANYTMPQEQVRAKYAPNFTQHADERSDLCKRCRHAFSPRRHSRDAGWTESRLTRDFVPVRHTAHLLSSEPRPRGQPLCPERLLLPRQANLNLLPCHVRLPSWRQQLSR